MGTHSRTPPLTLYLLHIITPAIRRIVNCIFVIVPILNRCDYVVISRIKSRSFKFFIHGQHSRLFLYPPAFKKLLRIIRYAGWGSTGIFVCGIGRGPKIGRTLSDIRILRDTSGDPCIALIRGYRKRGVTNQYPPTCAISGFHEHFSSRKEKCKGIIFARFEGSADMPAMPESLSSMRSFPGLGLLVLGS